MKSWIVEIYDVTEYAYDSRVEEVKDEAGMCGVSPRGNRMDRPYYTWFGLAETEEEAQKKAWRKMGEDYDLAMINYQKWEEEKRKQKEEWKKEHPEMQGVSLFERMFGKKEDNKNG